MRAQEIIEFLLLRAGFDAWWYEIDENVRDEILDELDALLAAS